MRISAGHEHLYPAHVYPRRCPRTACLQVMKAAAAQIVAIVGQGGDAGMPRAQSFTNSGHWFHGTRHSTAELFYARLHAFVKD